MAQEAKQTHEPLFSTPLYDGYEHGTKNISKVDPLSKKQNTAKQRQRNKCYNIITTVKTYLVDPYCDNLALRA